jgi:hypothetical protein
MPTYSSSSREKEKWIKRGVLEGRWRNKREIDQSSTTSILTQATRVVDVVEAFQVASSRSATVQDGLLGEDT